ncbi:hypothetical protein BGZ54_000881 [Gamsiella multidivaricata]|nr:hypothetical protein BGZ54_000881 [Gamsiella multidivaricata]
MEVPDHYPNKSKPSPQLRPTHRSGPVLDIGRKNPLTILQGTAPDQIQTSTTFAIISIAISIIALQLPESPPIYARHVDLIWLNEKERQRKRGASTGSGLKPVPDAAASSTSNRSDSDIHYTPEAKATATPLPRVHSCADDYHGLRVSEYTILMNWISYGTEALEPTSYNCSRLSLSSSSSLSPSTFLPLKHQGSPIDKAWATWQDFLLTGMKPDVVLYTAMLNTLLRTKEFDRAGQLWSHMHHQDGHEHRHLHHQGEPSDLSSDSKVDTIEDPGLVSKPLDLETISVSPSSSRNVNTPSLRTELQNPGSSHLPDMDPRSRHQHYLRSSSKGSWSRASVTPNVQTFSVLMQTHVLNRDLQGVSQTYKALLQQQQAFSQSGSHSRHQQYQRRANATVMNQVLRVLVDMGESKAAKEVYAEMRTDGPESSGGSSEGYTLPAREMLAQEGTPEPGMSSPSPFNHAAALSSSPVFTKPLHHQLFLRRSDWRRKVRKIASTPSVNHGDATAAGALTMRPDKTTHRLMLELARREADHELEELVIKDTSTKK